MGLTHMIKIDDKPPENIRFAISVGDIGSDTYPIARTLQFALPYLKKSMLQCVEMYIGSGSILVKNMPVTLAATIYRIADVIFK